MAPRQAVHELWCPPSTDLAAVDRLVLARYPAAGAGDGARQLTRHSVLGAPERDPRDHLVWTATTLRERGDAALPGQVDRLGFGRAFPDGVPVLEERRVLELLVGLARRTGGSLVVDADDGPGGRALAVDPVGTIDLRVLSTVALDPHEVLAAVAGVEPSARLAMEGYDFEPAPADRDPHELVAAMGADERAAAAAVSDAHDERALTAPDWLDAFAVEVPLGAPGALVVEAHAEDDPPPAVRALGWADVVAYDVRWLPSDPLQGETDQPDEPHRAARQLVRPRLRASARALAELAAGEVVDADGLPVSRYDL